MVVLGAVVANRSGDHSQGPLSKYCGPCAPKLNILYTASETRRTVRSVAAMLRLVGGVR
jgi:hypothetical protein